MFLYKKITLLSLLALLSVDIAALNDSIEQGPLHEAATKGKLEIVKYLIKDGTPFDKEDNDGNTPLKLAINNRQRTVARYLTLVKDLFTALEDKDSIELIKFLVEHGAPVNAQNANGRTPLSLAASNRKLNIFKYLVEKAKANVNITDKDGWAPLHWAAYSGNLDIVKYLVDNGAYINVTNGEGETSLHLAAVNGNFNIVKYLIEKGANINVKNKIGWAPLHWAAAKGNFDIFKYLVANGAKIDVTNVNVVDKNGLTPLHYAAVNGNFDIVKYLVEKAKANVNITDKNGLTPLHYAAYSDNLDIVKFLVEHGVPVNTKDKAGHTALDVAVTESHPDIINYLTLVKDFFAAMADENKLESFLDKYLTTETDDKNDKIQVIKNIPDIWELLLLGDTATADYFYNWSQKNGVSLQSAKLEQWDMGLIGLYLELFKKATTKEQAKYWYYTARENIPQNDSKESRELANKLEVALRQSNFKSAIQSQPSQLNLQEQLLQKPKFQDIGIKFEK